MDFYSLAAGNSSRYFGYSQFLFLKKKVMNPDASFFEVYHLIITALAVVLFIATFITTLNLQFWWVRMFDFPRIQIIIMLGAVLVGTFVIYDFVYWWHFLVVSGIVASIIYQITKIFPYTTLAKKEVLDAGKCDQQDVIAIMVSNVLQSNRNAKALVNLVNNRKPDILLTLETNKWWQEQLKEIEKDYPNNKKVPLENRYGMHLYSKLKLDDVRVDYLIQDDIPSIEANVTLRNDRRVKIHCVHPRPPSPTEADSSVPRDAELLLTGRRLKPYQESILVFGDLNDVAWSDTTRLFQKISGLGDPRKGRGFFNTFNAHHWYLRWPLDHLFHTTDFKVVSLERLPSIGSDHFPILIKLCFDPSARLQQETPDADHEDQRQADEKIKNGEELQ
jgi:endonuclease/exonuclease/phosphatase (EEP) superfamily protein YafD